MRYSFFFLSLMVLPFLAMSQVSPNWSLYLNKIKLVSASVDSAVSVELARKSKGSLKVCFKRRDTAFKRSVILMDEQRQTIAQKELKTNLRMASFSVDDLLSATKGKPFTIYVTDIPADPAKAMLVRMAPVAICHVAWKE